MEHIDFGRFALSFLFVLLLMLGLSWLALKSGVAQKYAQKRSDHARLKVVDKLMLDPRHKLMLVRRDDKEHLILLGATHSLLLESFDASDDQTSAA